VQNKTETGILREGRHVQTAEIADIATRYRRKDRECDGITKRNGKKKYLYRHITERARAV
jgi:hypothetical protein